MNAPTLSRAVALLFCASHLAAGAAVVFTNDTIINSFDTNYDGGDIVVTNCTVTVNGPHAFQSLLVAAGGTLTHSYSGTANVSMQQWFPEEPQVLGSTNPVTLLNTGVLASITVSDTSHTVIYTNNQDYVATQLAGGWIQLQRTTNSTIPDGATVLVLYSVSVSTPTGLYLTITGDVAVASGGAINANGGGYNGGTGPGYGHSFGAIMDGSGGGYGGIGGTSSSNAVGGVCYGAFDQPNSLGSGGGSGVGGPGGPGGGLVWLSVGGTLTVDGLISAQGGYATNSRSGGGSGGTIRLSAGLLTGAGAINANGGPGEPIHGGGGGGGRISVSYGLSGFSGSMTAYGGNGWQAGGAGTVYTSRLGFAGIIVVDNGGQRGTNTTLSMAYTPDVILRGNARVTPSGSWVVHNLTVASNGWLLPQGTYVFNLNAMNITVEAGGGVVADGTGNGPGAGYGAGGYAPGSQYICGGGGHGGFGGRGSLTNASGGLAYNDYQNSPDQPGSGGGYTTVLGMQSGSGGGAIHLMTTADLRVDGLISVNGTDGQGSGGGGGSGGSIWLSSVNFSGSGTITANGGDGAPLGGGGGGGRIALSSAVNTFTGVASAYGGGGFSWGGAGTVWVQTASASQLLLDNAGHRGTNTAIQSASYTALIVRNGAVAVQNYPPQTFASLLIGSNGWITANSTPGYNYPGVVDLTVGNAVIQPGGGIFTDAMGYGGGLGPGAGRILYQSPYYYPAGGGGHGGYGGSSLPASNVGGNAGYDSMFTPNALGSGGGQMTPNYIGGAGGGQIHLAVTGTLQLDGIISANGSDGSGLGGGGGAGGSVYLQPGTFTGSGVISVNGGNGAYNTTAGGGGGGRVAIYFFTNSFHGLLSAYGGGQTNWGGAGTIYLKTNMQAIAQLVLDNAGHVGTNSPLSPGSLDLTIRGGAVGQMPSGTWVVRNLLVQSNSALMPASSPQSQTLLVTANAIVEAGGAISADGTGYYFNNPGPGSGFSSSYLPRGGGGHGGWGGANLSGRGGAYDLIANPVQAGSVGGSFNNSSSTPGGSGGGALQINVTGSLVVNGRLSANGFDGAANSGGGAGGSLWVIAGLLTGSGQITANGGAGIASAGGGGGGRIFFNCTSNLFIGPVLATGGNGLVPGGAGTIYVRPKNGSANQVTIDNGGLAGTNTPFSSAFGPPSAPFDLLIGGGAIVQPFTAMPVLSNLTVAANSGLILPIGQSYLTLVVLKNANIASGATVSATGAGFAQNSGPGAGTSVSSKGAGGSYGGIGGASASGASGGATYGSAVQPTDLGSGGGLGGNALVGGSQGGGALRLSIGGTLNVDGTLSSDGAPGLQDDSGGGSGGSIWVSANAFSGSGWLSASGGSGDLYGGGGGGGGRIAIYAPMNTYTGAVFLAGGAGANFGQPGTLVLSNTLPPFLVTASSPSGLVSNTVGSVDLTLSDGVNGVALSASGFTLYTPSGPLYSSNTSAGVTGTASVRFSFSPQNQLGDYRFEVDSGITNILGQGLSQSYTGYFSITLPTIAGTVTDTNGQPVAGVLLQPSDVLTPAITDANGNYSLGVPPGWTGSVTPAYGTSMFIPGSLAFTNVTLSLTNQNFLMVPTIAPLLSTSSTPDGLGVSWTGLTGVSYQAWWSTNLVDWQPLGTTLYGSNALLEVSLSVTNQPGAFLRVQASD